MTTHAQEAKRLLKIALSDQYVNSPAGYNASVLVTQRAQVHATLELAEQQRATNLILATALSFGWGKADITAPWDSVNDTARWEAVRAEIAAALGITEES